MDKRIGAQLYTVRDFTQTKEDFDSTLKKLSEIGYKTVQISAIGNIPAKDLKEVCDKYNILPICTHRGYDEYMNNLDFSIEFHKTLGCKVAGLGCFPNLWGSTSLDEITKFITDMNKVAAEFKKHGMSFAYHNHNLEFVKFEGKYMMDYLIEYGDFDFIVDVYWLAAAGINPADFIKKLGKRAKILHFKDLKVVPGDDRQIAEVMEGNLDWDSIIEACEEAGSEYAFVEQDTCQRDPFESLKISYDNLKTKGFF